MPALYGAGLVAYRAGEGCAGLEKQKPGAGPGFRFVGTTEEPYRMLSGYSVITRISSRSLPPMLPPPLNSLLARQVE